MAGLSLTVQNHPGSTLLERHETNTAQDNRTGAMVDHWFNHWIGSAGKKNRKPMGFYHQI